MTNKIFKILYIVLIIIFAISFFRLKELPGKNKILPQMMNEPIQATSTTLSDFDFNYRNVNYQVKPIADYELWGLIVSVNDIKKWYNFYHDKNSVNLKDICVVWGSNISSGAYKKIKFKSGEWTCYARWDSNEQGKDFKINKLSNNHLFSDNKKVRNIIRKMNTGDQVHIIGTLSKYAKEGSKYYRGTSLTRNDTGNGACEVVYVQKAEILKKSYPDWHIIHEATKNIFIFLIIIQIVLFIKNIKEQNKILKNK